MKNAETSSLPWEVVEANEHHGAYIAPVYGGDVCDLYAMSNPMAASVRDGGNSYSVHFDNSAENAKLIVLAVNAHDALVAALEELRASFVMAWGFEPGPENTLYRPVLDRVDAALHLAKHGAS